MLITFVSPIVMTKEVAYSFREARDTIRIYVGYSSPNQNVETIFDLRNWFLRDRYGNTIDKGQVNVKLGTFDRYVDLTSLVPNEVYVFTIENPGFPSSTTVISGIDPSTITVVDETKQFSGNPLKVGDIIFQLTNQSGDPDASIQVRLTSDWTIGRTQGNGLIFSGGKTYAYAPKKIFTRNKQAPSVIDFVPFPGLPVKQVPVYILPDIVLLGNHRRSITPPTRVIATFLNYDGSKDTYDSVVPVSILDTSSFSTSNLLSTRIRAVF